MALRHLRLALRSAAFNLRFFLFPMMALIAESFPRLKNTKFASEVRKIKMGSCDVIVAGQESRRGFNRDDMVGNAKIYIDQLLRPNKGRTCAVTTTTGTTDAEKMARKNQIRP